MAESEERPREGRPLSVLGHPVTGLLPIILLAAGWITLAIHVMPRVRGGLEADSGATVSALLRQSPALTLLVGLAAGALFLGVVTFLIWARSARGFGPLVDGLLRRDEALAALLLISVGVITCGVISSGEPTSPRALSHVARSWLWHESLRSGTIPRWTDLWYNGFPAGQHFPPLTHLITALLGFLHFSPSDSAKDLAWFTRIAGGIGFGLLCARVHRDQRAGFLGGILYGLAPTFHAAWMVDGRLPATFLLGALPWALYMAERLAAGDGGFRSGAIMALCIGAIALSSIAQSRLTFILVLGFLAVRAIPIIATRGERVPSAAGLVIGLVGGVALASGFIVPLARDAYLLNNPVPESLGSLRFHVPELAAPLSLVSWNARGAQMIGISVLILSAIGIARAILDRRARKRAMGPIPLAVMVLLPWSLVPFSARYLDLMPLGLLLAAAGTVRRGDPGVRVPFPTRGVFPAAMLLVLAELAPVNLSTSYTSVPDPEQAVIRSIGGALGSGRFLELPLDARGNPTTSYAGFAIDAPIPGVGGPYLEGAPKSYTYTAAVIDSLARAIRRDSAADPDLIRLAALHNVKMILFEGPEGVARADVFALPGLIANAEHPGMIVPDATPVWILEPGGDPDRGLPREIVTPQGLSREARARLVSRQIEWMRASRPRPVTEARAVALPNRTEIELPDLGPVTIRIARNAYPSTQVTIDDRPWPWREGPFGGIEVDIERGPHRIRIEGTEDRLRRALRIGQWALAGLLLVVAAGPRRR